MPKSLLKKLYNGELYPAERITIKDPEFEELNQAINDEEAHIQSLLPDTDQLRFEKLNDLRYKAERIESIEHFTYGFRLGVCLMIETFTVPGEYGEE